MTSTCAGPDRRARQNAYAHLARADDAPADLVARCGQPDPFIWSVLSDTVGADGFAELVFHIVSQQISTQAALTVYNRFRRLLGGDVGPGQIIATPIADIRSAGLSGAKARSVTDLAERVVDRRLSLDALADYDDAKAQTALMAVRGVGPWSAQMFLLHHFRRPDILPAADAGLLRAARSAFGLAKRPTSNELERRSEPWRPFRSYAAALLWAHGQELPALPDAIPAPA